MNPAVAPTSSAAARSVAPAASAPAVAIEAQARGPLLVLLASGLLWFVAGGALALIHSIQLHTPAFFARQEAFTFGRVQAAAETALVFGWAANAGFAVAWWLLGRLGAEKPRGLAAALVGALFWNAGITAGVIGILSGDLGPYALLQMPAYVAPLLGIAYAAFGVAGFAAWIDRRQPAMFAAQWYAIAAILALPWFYSAAAAMLAFNPVVGASQAIVAAWAGEGLRTLWLAPLALAGAYYLVPKLTGEAIAGYGFAPAGFWVLALCAPWAGTRTLVGGPVPVWVPTVGICATILLVLHYLVVTANFRSAFASAGRSQALRFVLIGVAAYVLLGGLETALALRAVAQYTQFTYLGEARFALLLFGVFSPVMFGVLYFLVPRLTGRAWASAGLIWAHYRALWLGLLVLLVGLIGAGVSQALGLVAVRDAAGVITTAAYADLFADARPWLLIATHGIGLQLLGGVLFLANAALQCVPAPAAAPSSSLAPAHAS